MAASTEQRQLTSLLSNATLSRVERLRIAMPRLFTDRRRGEHTSGRSGTSNEFSDFRNYVSGDDVRFVDWNIFARLNRPYIKLYMQEEEMNVAIFVDASTSMLFEGKFELACRLAAAFGVMGLFGGERVSVYGLNQAGRQPASLLNRTGRSSMASLFRFLESLDGGGDLPVEEGIESALKRHVGRGIAIIISDFLSFGDLRRAFNLLFSSGMVPCAIHVLGPSELDPELSGDSRLVDSETNENLDVTCSGDLVDLYHEYRQEHERTVSLLCRQRSGRFAALDSSTSVEDILFDMLRRGGWLR
ncbi:MAG: DUF58 domain-containing protein [Lentisphaerae bacterium]|jgi:uncharacterized protein (DUF58 family)|nr:DUF58 domain-containing protein [Lentisphaerota bacterium]MBT4817226.1 DUF58 domain-containing protein [Lentisphaerota bacterium]MBT5604353.1 DUF58 domain-containing protein [Lentisphaerota bacterium]MBT7053448.1 DUF58 domain-containing protein [Lentisphaerota bacterium]MBT7847466.1 DUF58 domain-containing protein [Lentisphaerota bacterium]